ncbi:MAG: hypothetical protein CMC81_07420 [Flavobacteriaceae bacterium]|nr:hypothetical protein [Flavobacteriaceae bacterium]|tara:strand:+ start:1196 stop:1708 length:513 start_codon:yes stop_codon:yes gene_type:complete
MKITKLYISLFIFFLSCAKDDNSEASNDFFANQRDKIWAFTEINISGVETTYVSFYEGTMKYIKSSDNQSVCYEKFLGQVNDIVHPIEGWRCNISNNIILNKSNELQIETIVTEPDGTFKYSYVVTLIVNNENLSYFNVENDATFIGFNAKEYLSEIDLSYDDCEIDYIL